MAPINCAVLGMGMSALVFHTPFILALPDLFSLHTIMERKATATFSAARQRFPGVNVVNSLAAVLADPEIEVRSQFPRLIIQYSCSSLPHPCVLAIARIRLDHQRHALPVHKSQSKNMQPEYDPTLISLNSD